PNGGRFPLYRGDLVLPGRVVQQRLGLLGHPDDLGDARVRAERVDVVGGDAADVAGEPPGLVPEVGAAHQADGVDFPPADGPVVVGERPAAVVRAEGAEGDEVRLGDGGGV